MFRSVLLVCRSNIRSRGGLIGTMWLLRW